MIYQNLWFVLWSLLWIIYFMLDGYDIGVGIVSVFVAKNDEERQIVIRSIGPFWDGNEVWLVTAGGATFAAFPKAYAGLFSYLYTPFLLLLFILILRGVSIEFGYTEAGAGWRRLWHIIFFVSSLFLAILFGFFFGNLFKGLPIDQNGLQGGFFGLLTPAGVVGALVLVSGFALHGAQWVYLKTNSPVKDRTKRIINFILVSAFVFSVFFFLLLFLNPLFRRNFIDMPVLFVFPLCALALLVYIYVFYRKGKEVSFKASMFFIFFLFTTGFAGMYPALVPSSISEEFSFTIYNSSSGQYTLQIMTVVALLFVPVVIFYQIWIHKIFKK